jgi:ectoine hydroxylase-related dioxygenase (phytanoyl-CoA dioxygenase family)
MDEWFSEIAAICELTPEALEDLHNVGFVVIAGPVQPDDLAQLARAYDSAVNGASSDDLREGSTTTRVQDFVNRGPEFDELYLHRPLLEACCRVIGQPFRLSTMMARIVRPHAQAQEIHVDFAPDADGWPMIGFIYMVDEFRHDNGPTRFVPGSHRWANSSSDLISQRAVNDEDYVQACGAAGSMIIYNGSIWHGHSANRSGESRRSIQGAYIRREAPSGSNLAARMHRETLARISPLAKYLLAV